VIDSRRIAPVPFIPPSPPLVGEEGDWGEGEGHTHLATPNTVAIGTPAPLRLHQDGEGDLYGLERHS
jgi:hypothetical protein